MYPKKIYSLILIIVLITIFAAGCGGGNKSTAKYMRVAIGAEPETLDPRKSVGAPEAHVERQIFEGLCTKDKDGNPVPAAAERWIISPDGMKYTFYLRSNAKWSNGEPVTAHDFEYAWKTALSPELGSKYADQLYYLKNGEAYNKKQAAAGQVGVKALDDLTLEVTLERPTAYFLVLTSFHTYYPVHKKTVETNPNWANDPKTLVSNGPFKITNWIHDNKIEFAKNAAYWDQTKVRMDKLEFILASNNKTVLDMFENNQVDLADVPPPSSEISRLSEEGKLKIYPFLSTYYFTFNVNQAPFDNPKVRKAFALAVNRELLVSTVVKGGQKAALAWVPVGLADSAPGSDFRNVGGAYYKDNDIETAKKLLAEAGYPNGQGLPPITLLYNTSEEHKIIAEAMQEMWKKNLGITVNLTNQDWKVYLQSRNQGAYQIVRSGWVGDYNDPMTFMDMWMTGNGNNVSQWSNPEYDRLVKQAMSSLDQDTRMKAMHQAETILMEEMPLIPIYFYTNRVLQKPNVKGVHFDILGMVYLKEAYMEN